MSHLSKNSKMKQRKPKQDLKELQVRLQRLTPQMIAKYTRKDPCCDVTVCNIHHEDHGIPENFKVLHVHLYRLSPKIIERYSPKKK